MVNKLGFGFLRLPCKVTDDENTLDYGLINEMVDAFLAAGRTYFDTAYTYLNGLSEVAIRKCLVERYPREQYQLADKLPSWYVKSEDDCERYFQQQCRRCGVDWFDVYLLHWLNRDNFEIAERYDEFGFLRNLKVQGKAKQIGFSYHGDAALLDEILTKHPEVDIVQLQINYLDWDDSAIESRKCYETAVHHGKQIVVMEPVKGGTLADLPEAAHALLKSKRPHDSAARWALRFVQSLSEVKVVLSGMNTMEQMADNLQDMEPMSPREYMVLDAVVEILNKNAAIGCTGCRYCVPKCPQKIAIPDYFGIYNSYCRHPEDDWKMQPVYDGIALNHGKASECICCRLCERNCPQQIQITDWLPKVVDVFER